MSNSRRRGRSRSSLRRRPGYREPKPCILIVCEGEKTEPCYFEALRETCELNTVDIEVIGGDTAGSAPISVVNYALRMIKQRKQEARKSAYKVPFDMVWCVFDQENPPHASFKEAIDKAETNDIFLAVSTPAFEYWYLLHFEDTDRPFLNADEVIQSLKRHLPDYDKKDIFSEIADRTEDAIQRARHVWKNRSYLRKRFPNPSTSVYKLVGIVIKLGPISQ